MIFTWESSPYGYGEWVEGGWTWLSFKPDVTGPDGYGRPEGVQFTAVVEEPTIPIRVRVTFSYANRSLLVDEAVRED